MFIFWQAVYVLRRQAVLYILAGGVRTPPAGGGYIPASGVYIPESGVRTPPAGGVDILAGGARTPPAGGVDILAGGVFRQAVYIFRQAV